MNIEFDIPLAFSLSLYKDLPPTLRQNVITEDLAGFYIEAAATKLEERTNPRELKIINGEVYDPVRQEYVKGGWKGGNQLADIESLGAKRFYTRLLREKGIVINISPPGGISPYKETRINVAHFVKEDTIHLYGIASRFDREECMNLAWKLNNESSGFFDPQTPDDLRHLPISIIIPDHINTWDFLNSIAKLDSNAWEDIKNGNPWIRKKEMLKKAREAVAHIEPQMIKAKTQYDFIHTGAELEFVMQAISGVKIDTYGCAGEMNSDIVQQTLNVFGVTYDSFGNIRSAELDDGKGPRKFKCPACGHINERPWGELVKECQNKDCTDKTAVAC